jgi:hypothetical protein
LLLIGLCSLLPLLQTTSFADDTKIDKLERLLNRARGISTNTKGAKSSKQRQHSLSKEQSSGFLNSGARKDSPDPYAPKPVLSLVVNGTRQDHLVNALRKLSWLSQYRKVKIGSVLIAGRHSTDKNSRQKVFSQIVGKDGKQIRQVNGSVAGKMVVGPQVYPYIEKVGLSQYEVIESRKVIDRLKITYSPTWIVRHLGRDYIFEGYKNPVVLFDKNGGFIGE